MESLVGREIARFYTKDKKQAVISYMSWGDLHDMRVFINTVSQEDTYITLSGEEVSLEEEMRFVSDSLKEIELRDAVFLVCRIDGFLVSIFSVFRNKHSRKRELHVGTLGLIVSSEYRNQGIGKQLLQIGLDEVKRTLKNLGIVTLSVFASNEFAHRLYMRNGFREYGRLPRGVLHKDTFVDHIYMYTRLSE